jgi:hypothetical protein
MLADELDALGVAGGSGGGRPSAPNPYVLQSGWSAIDGGDQLGGTDDWRDVAGAGMLGDEASRSGRGGGPHNTQGYAKSVRFAWGGDPEPEPSRSLTRVPYLYAPPAETDPRFDEDDLEGELGTAAPDRLNAAAVETAAGIFRRGADYDAPGSVRLAGDSDVWPGDFDMPVPLVPDLSRWKYLRGPGVRIAQARGGGATAPIGEPGTRAPYTLIGDTWVPTRNPYAPDYSMAAAARIAIARGGRA